MAGVNDIAMLDHCLDEFIRENELKHTKSQAFELFSIIQLTKALDLSISEIETCIVDGGNDGGLDGFVCLINHDFVESLEEATERRLSSSDTVSIYLIQSKTPSSFKERVLDEINTTIDFLYDLSKTEDDLLAMFNPKVVEKTKIFHKLWYNAVYAKAKIDIRYFYVSKGDPDQVNGAFKKKKDSIVKKTTTRIIGARVTFELIGVIRLLELHRFQPSQQFTLEFRMPPTPFTFPGNQGIGFIGTVPLANYNELLLADDGSIRASIFESNVRDFQGSVQVNTNILKTLQHDTGNDFWWLNNGVTIITSHCAPYGNNLVLTGAQIVNGLQTSYCIYDYFKGKNPEHNDPRAVLVKVISTQDKGTINRVIAATNSQTPINAAQLRATDELQLDLETFFLQNHLYYERRKNYYRNQGKPANKIFSVQELAQCIKTVLNFEPGVSRARPTSLLNDEISYKAIFQRSIDFTAYLHCIMLYRVTKDYLKESRVDERVTSNFHLHMTRTLASVITGKAYYTSADVCNTKPSSVNREHLDLSSNLIASCLDEYSMQNPSKNIINIAKSSEFSTFLSEYLKTYVGASVLTAATVLPV